MNAYKMLVTFTLIVAMLSACETTPTPSVLIPNTGDAIIGTVNTIQTHVQAGPIGSLNDVPISQTLYSHDAVHVIGGGVALLNFLDQIALKLFNDTSIGGANVEILESTNRRIHLKLERGGLSGQVVKDSGGADFEIANGVHIYILGTSFYITYDPATGVVSAGNFDGIVGYQVPGQSPQMLPQGSLLDVLPGGAVQLFNMPFDIKAFELAAQTDDSPIHGLRNLRGLSATLTPVTTSTITPTQLPTSCPIPAGWEPVIVLSDDTLFSLSARYDISAEALAQGNCLGASSLITSAIIYVPVIPTATYTPLPIPCSHPPMGWVTYIVQSGDTLSGIGLKFGVTTAVLQNGNCMGYSSLIYTGQILYVPYVATSTPVTFIPDIPQPPSITPTPIDAPTYFQYLPATVEYCTISFSVIVSDPDGISGVEVIYKISGSDWVIATMRQIEGVFKFSTSPRQNTTPSDTITYYFKATDWLGRTAKSTENTIQAGDCRVGMGMQ